MPRKVSPHPTELELAILRVIWRRGPSTVREICDALETKQKPVVSSTITVLKIMLAKGYLTATRRKRADGGTLYHAVVREERTARNMLEALAQRLCNGSIATVLQNLIRSGEIDRNELEELRKVVNQDEKNSSR
jgi:predicted transcriptional regulator